LNYYGWQGQLLKDNHAGFGCKLCDVDEFVERVLYLNSHRQEVLDMGRNARQVAIEKYDRQKLTMEALEVITSVQRTDRVLD